MAPALSSRDMEVLAAAFQCLKTSPEIDYDKLAEKAGYKNGSSARACFQEVKKKLRATGNDIDGDNANKKPTIPKSRKRKQLSSPSDSSSVTLASSSPTLNSDDESKAPAKKAKARARARNSKTKTPVISTPETEEEIHNAKAIAAGRAKNAADKLAAEIKREAVDEEEMVEEGQALGMNVDEGEDEGETAYELVKNEIFGVGVEV